MVTERRLCPTRPDGVHALIAQSIAPATCLERQRRLYHKCYACRYQGLSAEAQLAPEVVAAARAVPVPVPALKSVAATATKSTTTKKKKA